MRLPFNLDFVSIIVGVLFAMFILPRIMGFFAGRNSE